MTSDTITIRILDFAVLLIVFIVFVVKDIKIFFNLP